jgi:hypothetical protein
MHRLITLQMLARQTGRSADLGGLLHRHPRLDRIAVWLKSGSCRRTCWLGFCRVLHGRHSGLSELPQLGLDVGGRHLAIASGHGRRRRDGHDSGGSSSLDRNLWSSAHDIFHQQLSMGGSSRRCGRRWRHCG